MYDAYLLLFLSVCVYVMVMPPAYVVSFTGTCGVVMFDVYMLKRVTDRTPPCGTLILLCRMLCSCLVLFCVLLIYLELSLL